MKHLSHQIILCLKYHKKAKEERKIAQHVPNKFYQKLANLGYRPGEIARKLDFDIKTVKKYLVKENFSPCCTRASKYALSIFEWLEATLGHDLFLKLFQLILTDNGSGFLNADALEIARIGVTQTKLFYCDPQASYRKGPSGRAIPTSACFSPRKVL